jgi:hypothetical protein
MTRAQWACNIVKPQNAEAVAMVNPAMGEPEMGDNLVATECNVTVANSASNKQMAPFTWQQVVEGKRHPNLEKLC